MKPYSYTLKLQVSELIGELMPYAYRDLYRAKAYTTGAVQLYRIRELYHLFDYSTDYSRIS